MFLPTTQTEMLARGWDELDVILVTGDSYIDSPFIGIAVIGKLLARAGYRVGVIGQPRLDVPDDILRLGRPRLFWGVSGGSIDSMVANYTALKKKRRSDDYTPGGENTRRPDRAVIVYSNLIRRFCKPAAPIVLGGIEASLRRVAHYDYWSDRLRGSILLDAKADYLVYGMSERAVLELAAALRQGGDAHTVRGLCYLAGEAEVGARAAELLSLPSFEAVCADKNAFIDMFHAFYRNQDPHTARPLAQQHGQRWLIHNAPAAALSQAEMDDIYALEFERAQHPYYESQGPARLLETVGFSIPTHRGCYGECNFCAIAVHEGRTVQSRSPASIIHEAEILAARPDFKGYLSDVGGPTANMYGFECDKKLAKGVCANKRCVFPAVCPLMKVDHRPQIDLLRRLRRIPGVKKVFVASGVRYDLLLHDKAAGYEYLSEVVEHHVSGQMKVAPEHSQDGVLRAMGKPGTAALEEFKRLFDRLSAQKGKPQFLTYYMIAAHPGCTEADMKALQRFASSQLGLQPEQVQIFTPTPSTYSSLMYYTEMDPFTRQPIFVEKDMTRKGRQKALVTGADASAARPQRRLTAARKDHPSGRSTGGRAGRRPPRC